MTAPGLSYTDLKELRPCTESMARVAKLMGGAKKWNGRKVSAADARAAGATFDDIVWAASALSLNDKDVNRRLRLWMADCAARVLHIFERDTDDDRPRNAIIAARQFARGEIDAAARDAARDAAWAAAWAAARDAACAAAWAAARDAAWAAARDAACAAAWDAAWAAARDAAWAAAWDAEESWQFDRLVLWLSENEPADYPLPERSKAKAA